MHAPLIRPPHGRADVAGGSGLRGSMGLAGRDDPDANRWARTRRLPRPARARADRWQLDMLARVCEDKKMPGGVRRAVRCHHWGQPGRSRPRNGVDGRA